MAKCIKSVHFSEIFLIQDLFDIKLLMVISPHFTHTPVYYTHMKSPDYDSPDLRRFVVNMQSLLILFRL